MGNVVGGRESIDDETACGISDFEHCFTASLEDASPGVVREPPEGEARSAGRPTKLRGVSVNTINKPLDGRLVKVHMMETELVLRETVGVVEQTVASLPYAAIRRLTWDHSQSSLKLGHTPEQDSQSGSGGRNGDPDDVFLSIRVENSLELEDELQQRAKAMGKRYAGGPGEEPPTTSESVYLGMFAGFTKPKPFQRKRPNLSSIVAEGALPSIKDMRLWSLEEHQGISRPQIFSVRPRLAMDAIFLGENRSPLANLHGLGVLAPDTLTLQQKPWRGDLVLTFYGVEVQLRDDCVEDVTLPYDVIDSWTATAGSRAGSNTSSGLELYILREGSEESVDRRRRPKRGGEGGREREAPQMDNGGQNIHSVSSGGSRKGFDRVFVGVDDENLAVTRNAMEFFWNRRRAELQQPPKAGSTHGRRVVSMVTLRGEEKATKPPTGRVFPVDLDGVEIRAGQEVHLSPRRGQVSLMRSPRTILGVDKKRTLRYNEQARPQWERVVLHQGWLRKRGGGAIKRWIWRYFVLFDTPQGHFLAYYDDASDVPLFSEARRERQLIDLCKVCFLRPEICQPKVAECEIPANAFTIVTTERQWTLCADSKASLMQWLRMLSMAIDEDVAIVDDGEAFYHVKVQWSPDGKQYGPERPATVHVGSMGMELRWGWSDATSPTGYVQPMRASDGSDGGARLMPAGMKKFWSFTDFYKWTLVVLHDGSSGLAIQCFTDGEFATRENLLLLTQRSKQLALVIEHQIEKFMALMHLRLELSADSGAASPEPPSDGASAESPYAPVDDERELRVTSMNLATDPHVWAGQTLRTEPGGLNNPFDFLGGEEFGYDDEEIDVDTWEATDLPGGSEAATGNAPDPWSDLLDLAAPDATAGEENGDIDNTLGGLNGTVGAPLGVKDSMVGFAPGFRSARMWQTYPPAMPTPPTPETVDRESERSTATSFEPSEVYRHHPGAPPNGAGKVMPAPACPHLGQWLLNPEGLDSSSSNSSGDSAMISPPTAPRGEGPPKYKPLLTTLNSRSSPGSTPPVTPLAATPFEDGGEGAVSSMPHCAGGALPAFAFSPQGATPPVSAKDSEGFSAVQLMHTHPVGTYRSRVISPPREQAVSTTAGEVLHNDRIYLRITLESRVRSGSSCFLGLRYELSALAPSATVTIDLMPGPTTSAVSASFDPSFEAFEVGGEPGGRKELRQTVSLSCSRPFSFPPEIAVVVTTGGREPPTITRVSLPVTVSTFLRGLPLNTDDFRQMWTALSSSGQITQAIVRDGDHRPAFGSVQGPRWGASVQPSDIRRLLFETMGMSEVPWKDKSGVGNIDLIAASGFMPLSPPGSREKGSIVCLVGVEIHGATGSARVTTKSTDRVLAEGIQREVMGGIDVAHRFHR